MGLACRSMQLLRRIHNDKATDRIAAGSKRGHREASSVALDMQRLQRALTRQLGRHNANLLQSARTFLPDCMMLPINDNDLEMDQVVVSRCEGALMLCDASGFTVLTEQLAVSAKGAEKLSSCLKTFFEPVIDIITAYSGDIIKFSGHALTVLFAIPEADEDTLNPCGSSACNHSLLELASLRACACSVEIHKRLDDLQLQLEKDDASPDLRLAVHIALGAGPMTILQVGGMQFRHEYAIAGEPLKQIAHGEALAGTSETVMSPECWSHVVAAVESDEIGGTGGYRRLKNLITSRHTYPTIKEAALQSAKTRAIRPPADHEEIQRQLDTLSRFVPRAVMNQFWRSSLHGLNQMRTVSVLFIHVKGVDPSTDSGAKQAGELTSSLQAACYSEEGSLNKILVNEEGLLYLFVFGLPPLVHIDDPRRAVTGALEMISRAHGMDLRAKAGATTGRVYCGIIGSDRRQEYTVIGGSVNLAKRLVTVAEAGCVLVDYATCSRCSDLAFEGPIQLTSQSAASMAPHLCDAYCLRCQKSAMDSEDSEERVPPAELPWLHNAEGLPTEEEVLAELKQVLPWKPQSTFLGGKSLLTELRELRTFQTVESAVNTTLDRTGRVLVLVGESSCGIEDYGEMAMRKMMLEAGLVPVFGTMEMKQTEQWAAPRELIAGLLCRLHSRSLSVLSPSQLSHLLQLEGADEEEMLMMGVGQVLRQRANAHLKAEKPDSGTALCNLAIRLMKAVLEKMPLLVVLRCWRNTALSPCDVSLFWQLATSLQQMFSRDSDVATFENSFSMMILCEQIEESFLPQIIRSRSEALKGASAAGNVVRSATSASARRTTLQRKLTFLQSVNSELSLNSERNMARVGSKQILGERGVQVCTIGPLAEDEVPLMIAAELGLHRQEPSIPIPAEVGEFLKAHTLNTPQSIVEAMRHLKKDRFLLVQEGAVEVHKSLEEVDVASWVDASFVNDIISEFEMMDSEAQQVMKTAVVLDGPVSSLDIASANRANRAGCHLLAFFEAVQRLLVCDWLVSINFLRRVPDYELPSDHQPRCLPRWTVANILIHKVVRSMLLKGQRIQMKRDILVARALAEQLPDRMRNKVSLAKKEESPGHIEAANGKRLSIFRSEGQASRISRSTTKEREKTTFGQVPTLLAAFALDDSGRGLPTSHIVTVNLRRKRGRSFDLLDDYDYEERGHHVMAPEVRLPLLFAPTGDWGVSTPDDEHLSEWLHMMCAGGYKERALQLLQRCAPVDQVDTDGCSALHFAAASGNLEIVEALLNARADAALEANDGETPLEMAAGSGHSEVVKYLLDMNPGLLDQQPYGNVAWWTQRLHILDSQALAPAALNVSLKGDSVAGDQRSRALVNLYFEDLAKGKDLQASAGKQTGKRRSGKHSSTSSGTQEDKEESRIFRYARVIAMSDASHVVFVIATILGVFGSKLATVLDVDQASKNTVLLLCFLILSVHVMLHLLLLPQYRRSGFLLLDMLGTVALFFETSWPMEMSRQTPLTETSVHRGQGGLCNVLVARLARASNIGIQPWIYPLMLRVLYLVAAWLRRPGGEGNFSSVEVFRSELDRGISTQVATLMVILVVSFQLLQLLTDETSDRSMAAWVTILSNMNRTSEGFLREVDEFGNFYNLLSYNPYSLCFTNTDAMCTANAWNITAIGARIPDLPPYFHLVIQKGLLKADFDFSQAVQYEAWLSIAEMVYVAALTVLTSLAISTALAKLIVRPLQRMLTAAKQTAEPILGDITALGVLQSEENDDEGGVADEVTLLERVISKLCKIASLAAGFGVGHQMSIQGLADEDQGVVALMLTDPSRKVSRIYEDAHLPQAPVQSLAGLALSIVEVDSWSFNVFQLDRTQQKGLSRWVLQSALAALSVDFDSEQYKSVLQTFLNQVEKGYKENPYHNWLHAVDVQHTTWRLVRMSQAETFLAGVPFFALVVSAISHDVGHPGVNNAFLVETGDELAVRYNDRSPLENMHCATMFSIAAQRPANIFSCLTSQQFFDCRRMCIEAILHTDMVYHFDMVKDVQMIYQMNSADTFQQQENKQKVMNLLLHSADIFGPCKPWVLCYKWATMCLEEFFLQGDEERARKIPVQPLNDRKVNRPLSQINFVEFMVVSLVVAEVKLFPLLGLIALQLEDNLQEWQRMWLEEANPLDEELDKVAGRIQKACSLLSTARKEGEAVWNTEKNRRLLESGSRSGLDKIIPSMSQQGRVAGRSRRFSDPNISHSSWK